MPNLVGGSIVWNLDVDSRRFDSGLDSAKAKASQAGKQFDDSAKSTGGLQAALEGAADASKVFLGAVLGVGAALGTAIGFSVKYAADLESMRAGFITLLGSANLADDAIKQIQKDAATTPFNFSGLVAANQQLTSVTGNAKESEKFLLNVGKAIVAMGKGQPELDRIIVNLQQIGAVGHASAIDLKQFAFAGIPIYSLLNEKLKGTGQNLDDMVSSGQITFKMLEDLFNEAGTGSGRFATAFQTMGGTFNQVWSNFIDNLGIVGSQIVKQTGLFDSLKTALLDVTNTLSFFATSKGMAQIIEFTKQLEANLPILIGLIVGGLTPALWAMTAPILAALPEFLAFAAAGAAVGIVIQGIMSAFSKTPNAVLIGAAAGITAVGIALAVVFAPAAFTAAAGAWALITPILIMAAPFIALGIAVAALVTGIVLLITHWGQISTMISSVAKTVGSALVGFFTNVGTIISGIFTNVMSAVGNFLSQIPGFLLNLGIAILNGFIFLEIQLPIMIGQALIQAGLALVQGIGFLVGLVIFGVPQIINAIVAFFVALPAQIMAVWTQIVADATVMWNNILAFFTVTIPALIASIVNFFIALPGQLLAIWNNILSTAVTIWNNIYTSTKTIVSNMINAIVAFFAALPGQVMAWINTTKTNTVNGFMDIFNAIVGEVSKWPGELYNWGVNIAESFVSGIRAAIGHIVDAFKEGLNNAKKMVEGHSPPIAGPFKNIDKWGFNVGMSWVQGMRDAIGSFTMPNSEYAYAPMGSGVSAGEISNDSTSITHSPVINITLGNFIGTEAEKRKFAFDLQQSLDQYYKGRGQ